MRPVEPSPSRFLHHLGPILVLAAATTAAAAPPPAGEPPSYVDATAATGLDFVHFSGATGQYHFPEISGAGGALLDFDGDGDLDLFLLQGAVLEKGAGPGDALAPPGEGTLLSDRLYRHDRDDGRMRFTDVTRQAGLTGEAEHGQAVAVGDYDGDGWVDVYVANAGPNRLWRNRGDGTFEDVTGAAGVGDDRWSAAAAFFDAEGDGDLDLYVANYVDYVPTRNIPCLGEGGQRDYCGPESYRPVPDRLFLNRGDGTFADATADAGLDAAFGPAFGVVSGDFDGDGHTDLFVANDGTANQLWMGRGDGTFRDQALLRGVALNGSGRAEASMGIAAGDPDEDGDEDLFVTHLRHETHTFYLNDGQGMFSDRTSAAGLAGPSLPRTGFGTVWTDHDLDGDLDLVITHGAVTALEEQRRTGQTFPFAEPGHLFVNRGPDGGPVPRFTPVEVPALAAPVIGRGLMLGDLDDDGDGDLVVVAISGPARVLLNTALSPGRGGDRWIGFRALLPTAGEGPPRDALGATVTLRPAGGGPARVRRVRSDGSYASGQDPRVMFGLSQEATAEEGDEGVGQPGSAEAPAGNEVEVRWPDGVREAWAGLAPGRYHRLVRGEGRAAAAEAGAPEEAPGAAGDAEPGGEDAPSTAKGSEGEGVRR